MERSSPSVLVYIKSPLLSTMAPPSGSQVLPEVGRGAEKWCYQTERSLIPGSQEAEAQPPRASQSPFTLSTPEPLPNLVASKNILWVFLYLRAVQSRLAAKFWLLLPLLLGC